MIIILVATRIPKIFNGFINTQLSTDASESLGMSKHPIRISIKNNEPKRKGKITANDDITVGKNLTKDSVPTSQATTNKSNLTLRRKYFVKL
ncbi:hypothetical protein [Enterococcus sp.]|uniref:hypothetical protein n=1 Tax=Enterococcus sp. TaxID=35783 RepID=UPI003C77A758